MSIRLSFRIHSLPDFGVLALVLFGQLLNKLLVSEKSKRICLIGPCGNEISLIGQLSR